MDAATSRAHGWKGKLWHDRYHLVPVSDEEEAQIRRLRYLLAAGVKELPYARPHGAAMSRSSSGRAR